MTVSTDSLISYVPQFIVRRLAAAADSLPGAHRQRGCGAVLCADVVGFTQLTEMLAERGPRGLEELTERLNHYMDHVVAIIARHGGDIVEFAGDALRAMWLGDDMAQATARAASCAVDVQRQVVASSTERRDGFTLRIGIGSGEFALLELGGIDEHWLIGVTGTGFEQAIRAEKRAEPGRVTLSPAAWTLVAPAGDDGTSRSAGPELGRPLTDGYIDLRADPNPIAPDKARPDRVTGVPAHRLRPYIPDSISARMEAGQDAWIAELRRLTVLFVSLPDIVYVSDLARAQAQIRALQSIVAHYEGSINKLSAGDNGLTLLAAFGLPPHSHRDDPTRGVLCATDMRAAMAKLDARCGIGVTTGRAFCGIVGSRIRREYTIIGDVVNLAARLMQNASGSILCDHATREAVTEGVDFEALPAIQVKGKGELIALYWPSKAIPGPMPQAVTGPIVAAALDEAGSASRNLYDGELVGRERECALAEALLQNLLGGVGGALVIEGEAGIGKSRFIAFVSARARALGMDITSGSGALGEPTATYRAWRGVVNGLLGLDPRDSPERQRTQVLNALAGPPDVRHLAPLLSPLLPFAISETDTTRQMTDDMGADHTHTLLVQMLQRVAQRAPLVVILEDAHYWDSASWALVLAVQKQVRNLLLVVSTQPLTRPGVKSSANLASERARDSAGDSATDEYLSLARGRGARELKLLPLGRDAVEALVCQRLAVSSLPSPVVELLAEQAGGHPLYSEELACSLRDAGIIEILDGEARMAAPLGASPRLSVPDTIEGVITSRVDRLTLQQQLVLKVASVIGGEFSADLLYDVYPVVTDKPLLRDYLAQLEARGFLASSGSVTSSRTYRFEHGVTQQIVYRLMPSRQRQQLHRAVAEWYERSHSPTFYALLAHHYRQAVDGREARPELIGKAVEYLTHAGEQAIRTGANREALLCFHQALELDDYRPEEAEPVRRAGWQRQLGEARFRLGQLDESRAHLQRAAALLGAPIPQLTRDTMFELGVQTARRLGVGLRSNARRGNLDAAARATSAELLRTYERLGQIHYFYTEKWALADNALRMLELAERMGSSADRARSYAICAIAAGMLPIRRLAEVCAQRSLDAMADLANEPGDLAAHAWALELIGLFALGVGQWQRADQCLQRALAAAESLGDGRRWDECLGLLDAVAFYRGQTRLDDGANVHGRRQSKGLHASARHRGDAHFQHIGVLAQAENRLRRGRVEQARKLLGFAQSLLSENLGVPAQLWTHGLLGAAKLHDGDRQGAMEHARIALAHSAETSPTTAYMLEGYAAIAEVHVTVLAAATGAEREELSDLAGRACAEFGRFAHVFPIAEPRHRLWCGRHEWLLGRRARAQRLWERALAAARDLDMQFERGLAHLALGRDGSQSASLRREHLQRAERYFADLGAMRALEQVREALSS